MSKNRQRCRASLVVVGDASHGYSRGFSTWITALLFGAVSRTVTVYTALQSQLYLLTCKVSRYWLLALHCSMVWEATSHVRMRQWRRLRQRCIVYPQGYSLWVHLHKDPSLSMYISTGLQRSSVISPSLAHSWATVCDVGPAMSRRELFVCHGWLKTGRELFPPHVAYVIMRRAINLLMYLK